MTLISPGASLLNHQVDAWGLSNKTLNIICPNAYHYLGVDAWRARFPNSLVYASKKAVKRLNKKGVKNIIALEEETPQLGPEYTFLFPPGHRGGDVWLEKRSTDETLWITCDSFLNYERVSNQPVARLLQKALGAAPGLKISQVIKWALLDQRGDFKAWVLEQLSRRQPTSLLPSHGELTRSPALTQDLIQLVNSRL